MKSNKEEEQKMFTLRLPYETWRFLKKEAYEQDISMQEAIRKCLTKYKKKVEKSGEVK